MSNLNVLDRREFNVYDRVAVLYGGCSAERDVSLCSGKKIYGALKKNGIQCKLIDAASNLIEQLLNYNPDWAFIALHGTGGEDGAIQGLLKHMNIAYPGCDVLSSALAMDKYRSKLLWQSVGLPTPDFHLVDSEEALQHCDYLLPAVVKPSQEGSSVGITLVNRAVDLYDAWVEASKHHGSVLVESYVDGAEFTVSILNGQALPVIRIDVEGGMYDYEAKYLSEKTRYILPCGLSVSQEQELQALALTAFSVLGCVGLGRVDFMQDSKGQFWLLEVNTIPGMTDHSLVPMAAKMAGIDFEELVMRVLKFDDSASASEDKVLEICA